MYYFWLQGYTFMHEIPNFLRRFLFKKLHNPTTCVIFAAMTNNHKIVDYDAVLDAKFGKEGTPERARAEEAAYSFYSGQILQDARKPMALQKSMKHFCHRSTNQMSLAINP